MFRKYSILALASVVMCSSVSYADEFRFPIFQPDPLCGDGPPLPSTDQAALAFIGGATYLAHYKQGGVIKELTFSIETPGAFLGDGFPADICGSTVLLSLDGASPIRGVMEYLPPIPNDEMGRWPYAVKLEWDTKREMRFSGSYSTAVWGAVEVPAKEGGFDRLFFTGARADRWD